MAQPQSILGSTLAFTAERSSRLAASAARLMGRILPVSATCAALVIVAAATAAAQEATVSGDPAFTVRRNGAGYQVVRGADSWTMALEGSRARLQSGSGATVASAVKSGPTITMSDSTDTSRYVVEANGDEYALKEHGVKTARVKIKGDKFNIYNGADQRTMHGKPKEGAWSVKKEDGSEANRITGPSSLREASYLAVPLPVEYRALLWALER